MYCSDWMFDISVGQVAAEFVSGDVGLEMLAKKYADGLSTHYHPIDLTELSGPAEELLLFLAEVEAGDMAVELIKDFSYFRLYNEGVNRPRKMKLMFGTIEDPVKVQAYSGQDMLKSFRAYVFGLRSDTVPRAPAGWSLETEESLVHFKELVSKKISFLDSI